MESRDLQPASSPWQSRKQEDGQAAGDQNEREEGDQEQSENQQIVSKDNDSSEGVDVVDGTTKGVLVSRVMFDAPQQYVQAARLIGRSEFTDMGGSSVACQFEAEGDGVGPMFGFGEEVYPDVLVDGIECLAYMSDREDDGDDELSMTDDENLGNVVSDSRIVDDDDEEDILKGYPFTVFLDRFFDDEDDNGDDVEDDTEDDEMFQFPDDPGSSEDLPRTLSDDSSDGSGTDVWAPWGRNRYPAESRGRYINSRGSGWSPWSSSEASSALPEDGEEVEIVSGDDGGGGAGSEVSSGGRYTDEDEYVLGNEEVADGDLSWLDAGNEETETGD